MKNLLWVGLLMVVMVGCAGMKEDGNAYSLVVREDTPLFEYGPRQTVPPSRILTKGTRVRLVAGGGGTHVMIETIRGERGFVATADLKGNPGS